MDEDTEQLLKRHKDEQRQLIATITGLKKQATKKTRRSVLSKCEELQEQLNRKQESELKAHEKTVGNNSENVGVQSEDDNDIDPADLLAQIEAVKHDEKCPENTAIEKKIDEKSKPKRNRQKERLARRKAKEEEVKEKAKKEAEGEVDYRQIEIDTFEKILKNAGLTVYDIKPDGHCLFASIQDQLKIRHGISVSVDELRKQAASYIKQNPDLFMAFLYDEQTDSLKDLDSYTEELVSTAMWGSDMEILALSKVYDFPISVYFAGSPTMIINGDSLNQDLKIAYFKHSYGLGEHYNSLRDKAFE